MSKRILWIDNDKVFLKPHKFRLEAEGYDVKQVFMLTEGQEALEKHKSLARRNAAPLRTLNFRWSS